MTRYNIRLRLAMLGIAVLALLVGAGPAWANCGSWTLVSSPSAGTLYGVAASSAADAWAVGVGPNGTLTEHWNGTSWTTVPSPSPNPTDSVLFGVAAFCPTDAWAVGYYGISTASSSTELTLIEHYNGRSWSVIPSPNGSSRLNFLSGVTALTFNNAWAVGYAASSGGGSQTLIEHWNGVNWAIVPSPNGGTFVNELNAVAAVSASDMWAVGEYYNVSTNAYHRLIEHYNGAYWSIVPSPDPGTQVTQLYGVAAISSTDVWAVGDYTDDVEAGYQSLTEHWDGTSWSVVASPLVSGLNAVAAVSSSNVWAVGWPLATGAARIEHWDGTRWSAVPSAFPVPGFGATLYGAAAVPGTSEIWAVGYSANNTGSDYTIIEHYC